MPATQEIKQDILMTGFPGFLASHLLADLLTTRPDANIHLLVLPKTMHMAQHQLGALEASARERCHLITGDITQPNLGLDLRTAASLHQCVSTVWHLAAIYDLTISSHAAYRVNVAGTVNVLDFCKALPAFERLNYVSTCYVSGDRTGLITEDELDARQTFKNYYEETKFWAEIEIQRQKDDVPSVIFRPGIVVGHSETGETDKFDGPYYLFKFLHELPKWLPVPRLDAPDALVNLVPIDFVVDAMIHISQQSDAHGKVYQIADPNPMSASDILALTLQLLGKKRITASLPISAIDTLLSNEKLASWTGLPHETVAYFGHDARYDTSNTSRAICDKTSLRCPHLSTYLSRLIQYMVDQQASRW